MLHTEYYRDGTPCECDVLYKELHPFGSFLWKEIPYINNKRQGIQKIYYESGALRGEVILVNDYRQSISKTYYESGALLSYRIFIDDREHGKGKQYTETGILEEECVYFHGKYMKTAFGGMVPVENFV